MNSKDTKGIRNSKDILKKVDQLCRENNLSYTLLFEALLSQEVDQKYSDWLSRITIGLIYPDYLRLMEEIKKEKDIYILNRETNSDYNALYTQVCKRSRVTLPEGREKDQPYYDYSIYIYPILYVGDSEEEFRDSWKKLQYYNRCLEELAYAYFQKGIRKKLIARQKRVWAKRRDQEEEEREAFFSKLMLKAQIPSKFVIIPWNGVMKGVMRLAKTYQNTEDYAWDGMKISCIREKQQWLGDCYSSRKRKEILMMPANRALVDGPETVRRVQLVALEMLHEFDRICKKHQIKYILAAGTLIGAVRHKGFIPWDDDIDIFMLEEEWIRFKTVAEKELDTEKYFLRTQETDRDMNLVFYQIKRNGTLYTKAGRDNFDTHRGIALDIIPFFYAPDSRILFHIQDQVCHFLKTMVWAHMGSKGERNPILRFYYGLMAKVSNKTSFKLFYQLATAVKDKKEYLTYLSVMRNPCHKGFNQRKYFEDLTELEFEGHFFPVPREYKEFLIYMYGEDYMKLPKPLDRVNKHLPSKIELNNLYSFDD